MMKNAIWIVAVILTGTMLFVGVMPAITQKGKTLPGAGIKDYSRPGAIVQGNTAYPTLPGSSIRDYSKPAFRIYTDLK